MRIDERTDRQDEANSRLKMRVILVFVSAKNSDCVLFFTVEDSCFFYNELVMVYTLDIATLSVFSHLTWRGISKAADSSVVTVIIFKYSKQNILNINK